MADSDVCTGGVRNVENVFESVKGKNDNDGMTKFVQSIARETQGMNQEERADFFAKLNSCNAARHRADPYVPRLEINVPAPRTGTA